jgi:Zn-dependent protease with chaperone function
MRAGAHDGWSRICGCDLRTRLPVLPYFSAALLPCAPGKGRIILASNVVSMGVSVILVVIALGSLVKLMRLRKGGKAIALALGGRSLTAPATDPDERELRNIVEQMSIASGVPVPAIYVLDREPGINAFAAGFRPEDAVIGLTKGAMQFLSRDEPRGHRTRV